ncbi:MAG: phosphodiester glycosidase family protein [Clostridia bacterium]|nr:phosphodiester glycosidase family protein [Clostridia bacterium]
MRYCWKKDVIRVIGLLLAILLLTACGEGEPAETEAESTQTVSETVVATTEAPKEYFKLSADVYVVRPTGELSETMLAAIKMISGAGKALVEKGITVTEDWYRDELVRHEFEILLGTTNRPESGAAYDALSYYDYCYEVLSPNVVVICGGSDSATLNAVQKFLFDCYGYRAGAQGEWKEIPVGTSYTHRQSYDLTLKLCGEPIGNYTIVHKDNALHLAAAKLLRAALSKACGVLLPLATVEEYQGGDAILLGMADTDGSHLYRDFGSYSFAMKYEKRGEDTLVAVDSTANINLVAQACADTLLTSAPGRGEYDIALSEEARIYCACADAMYGLSLVKVSDEAEVTDGLQYSKRSYRDKDGKPVVAYVLEVDLNKLELINATPNYGDVIFNVKATTLQAMKSADAAGWQVFAGVNADFFRINGDYSPQGLCVKEGKILSGVSDRPWFGITKEGTAVMGTASDYAKYHGKLREAVGGSAVLLRGGFVENVSYQAASKADRHPRTLVGIKEDGKVLLVAIDGRQAALSNGASLSDCAAILLELGAVDGVNLDGGGSTTVITSDGAGKYSVRNSPSDGSLRNVYNSLVVAKKEN